MKSLLLYLLCAAFFLSCRSEQPSSKTLKDPSAAYTVTFSADKQKIHVDARFSIDDPLIFMYVQQTKELPDGEASFIQQLVMKDADGNDIRLQNQGAGDWKHDARMNDRVTLSYDVELKHHIYPWPGGIDEVAFVRDDAVFFTGDAIFIVPGERLRDIDVTVSVPDGWNISVPWKKTGVNTFRAENTRDLLVNCGMVGTHSVSSVQIDSFHLQLAIGGNQKHSQQLFVNTLTPALRAYAKLFGGGKFSEYLIVIHDDVQSDGGAFRTSFSQVIDGEANEKSVVTWGHAMLHELFHLWNGTAIIPSSQEEWFKEGVTDYMTVKYLYSLNIVDENNFLKAMENTYRKYFLAQMMDRMADRPAISVRDAGNEKAKNRLMVYGGGSLIALMLDVELRERTGRARGIEDLLRMMYDEFGTTDSRYTIDDIIHLSSSIAGSDMKWFFDRYVTAAVSFDARPYYARLGLQLDTFVEEIYLSRRPQRTNDQKLLFRSVFGK